MSLTFEALEETRKMALQYCVPPAQLEKAALGMYGALLKDPYVLRLSQFIRSAADLIGEQRRIAMLLFGGIRYPERFVGTFGMHHPQVGEMPKEQVLITTGIQMLMAQPYLWRDDMRMAAVKSKLPDHVFGQESVPYPIMYWGFESGTSWQLPANSLRAEQGHEWIDDLGPDDKVIGDGVLLMHQENGMAFCQIGSISGPDKQAEKMLMLLDHFLLPYGWRYPSDWPEYAQESVRSSLAMLSFLNSPFIDKTPTRPNRAARRAAEKVGQETTNDSVIVVQLRQPRHETPRNSNGQEAEWKHQWIVRGHHRAQWYPSIQQHKVIWIAPHVKGPEGLPLLEKVYDVVR